MRKIGEIWDYLMRRKPILVALILAFILGIIGCAKILSPDEGVNLAQLSETSPELKYDNSLILVINGRKQPSYVLNFEQDFKKARVAVTNVPLTAETYIRIFDEQGRLLAGEYTVMQDPAATILPDDPDSPDDTIDQEETEEDEGATKPDHAGVDYVLTPETKSYELDLEPGYKIELRTSSGYFYSTLDNREAQSFRPLAGQTETYVVMRGGLRRLSWSEAEGGEQMYVLLRNYIFGLIADYQATVTDEVLNNKNLDLANKTRVLLSYYMLKLDDQVPYAEFMEHLRRGGSPIIEYSGPKEYEVGEKIEIERFLQVTDNEDGEITSDQIEIIGEIDNNSAGEYLVTIWATDSDQNQTSLEIKFTVLAQPSEEPLPPISDEPIIEDPVLDDPTPSNPIQPTIPVQTPVIEPERPIVGIFDRPSQSLVNQEQTVVQSPTDEESSTNDQMANIADDSSISKTDTPATNYQIPSTATATTTTTTTQTKKQVSVGDVALIAVGAITFLGLIKFIFDHYVR